MFEAELDVISPVGRLERLLKLIKLKLLPIPEIEPVEVILLTLILGLPTKLEALRAFEVIPKYLLDKLTPFSCKLAEALIVVPKTEPLIVKLLFKLVDVPIPIFPLVEINKCGLVETELLLALRTILQSA